MADFTVRLPRNLYRAEQVQQLDRIAIEDFSTPGFSLMQHAGQAAFTALLETWPGVRQLLVFVGGGNNGGDGYVIAGLAKEHGLKVQLIYLHGEDSLKGDAARARDFAAARQVPLQAYSEGQEYGADLNADSVIVDALLGTGLDRPPRENYARVIAAINASAAPVLAVDIPSGLNADTGNPMGSSEEIAVKADLTVTFIAMKQGLLTGMARDHVGELRFASLDVSDQVFRHQSAPLPTARRIDINDTPQLLPQRTPASHKGSHGHVLVLGGDLGFGGAVIMAAEAAARAGAGLVSVVTRSAHRTAAMSRRPELMVHGTEDQADRLDDLLTRASVLVIGPGLGRGSWSADLLHKAMASARARDLPMVLDADALHLLADRRQADPRLRRDNWILTPHPGEAAVLLDTSVAPIQQDRFAAVTAIVAAYGGTCLLKGSGSLIASAPGNQPISLCTEGNPGMATGGMGDVLSGLIAGLLAQGLACREALECAVCIHGEAADLLAADHGQRGMLATDLLQRFQQLLNPQQNR